MSRERGTTRAFPTRLAVAAVLIVVLLILVFQNSQTVSINVLVWDIEAHLIWSLLAVAGLGFLAGLILPRFRR